MRQRLADYRGVLERVSARRVCPRRADADGTLFNGST